MKKLAIITTHPIQYNAPLFKLLSKRGIIKIKIFYTWGQSRKELYDPGFSIVRSWDIPLLDGYDFEFINNISQDPGSDKYFGIINPTIISKIKGFHPDAILVFGWNFKSHLKIMRSFKGLIPVYFRGDSTLLDEQNSPFLRRLIRSIMLIWVYRFIDKALFVGIANKKYFLRHMVKKSQLVYAPHAIDNERFMNTDDIEFNIAEIRKKYNLIENNFIFLFSGKLENKKNISLLISSFLNIANLNARLLIVGNGPEESELKKLAMYDNRIIFMDFQNQTKMPTIYRLANVFVLPSKGPGETWGLSINESMACGIPVIVSDKVGCAEDLVSTETGWIFPSGNSYLLTKILKKAFSQSEMIYKMGKNAQENIKKFNFDNIAIAIENLMK